MSLAANSQGSSNSLPGRQKCTLHVGEHAVFRGQKCIWRGLKEIFNGIIFSFYRHGITTVDAIGAWEKVPDEL